MCHHVILQSHCMGFIEDLFNTNKVSYTVLEEMTADILKIAKDRAAQISYILGIKPQAEVWSDSLADSTVPLHIFAIITPCTCCSIAWKLPPKH